MPSSTPLVTPQFQTSLVRAISLQDCNPGGRVWVAKVYDQAFKKNAEQDLLTINTQRLSLNQKNVTEGYLENGNSVYLYSKVQNYYIVSVVSHDFNIIRRYNLSKALKTLHNDLIPNVSPQTISENSILLIKGWEEIVLDCDYFSSPTYSASTILKMHSENEEETKRRAELAMKQKDLEIKVIKRAQRIEKGVKVLRNIKNGIRFAINEVGAIDEHDFDKFVQTIKKTNSSFIQNKFNLNESEPLVHEAKKATKVVDFDNATVKASSGKNSANTIGGMMNSMKIAEHHPISNKQNNSNNIVESKPSVANKDLSDRLKIVECQQFSLNCDCNVDSGKVSGSAELRYTCRNAAENELKLYLDMNSLPSSLKMNPKVKRGEDHILMKFDQVDVSNCVKILKWDTKNILELPFQMTSWINTGPAGALEDLLIDLNFEGVFDLVTNFQMVLNANESLEEPKINGCSEGDINYNESTKQLIWKIDIIEDLKSSKILELSVFGLTSMTGILQFEYHDKSSLQKVKFNRCEIGADESARRDIQIEKEIKSTFEAKLNF